MVLFACLFAFLTDIICGEYCALGFIMFPGMMLPGWPLMRLMLPPIGIEGDMMLGPAERERRIRGE